MVSAIVYAVIVIIIIVIILIIIIHLARIFNDMFQFYQIWHFVIIVNICFVIRFYHFQICFGVQL